MTNEQIKDKRQLTIRLSKNAMSLSMTDATDMEQPVTYEPYAFKSSISAAANLREAIKTSPLIISGIRRAQIMTDSKVLLIPLDQFEETEAEIFYRHSYPQSAQDSIAYNVLPTLNAVAVFSINKDVRLVINDHFEKTSFLHIMTPIWHYLHQRSFTGHRNKLYGYFHDHQLEIFAFQQNRFKFCNTFEANRSHDALYFLLYVWKQLNLQPEHDEMHIVGDIPERDWILQELRKYLQKAYVINPTAEFNRAPATQIKGLPFDLMTLFTKGR